MAEQFAKKHVNAKINTRELLPQKQSKEYSAREEQVKSMEPEM